MHSGKQRVRLTDGSEQRNEVSSPETDIDKPRRRTVVFVIDGYMPSYLLNHPR